MKKKRFSHHVDIFCEMFCGWRLTNCYDRLVELGSGEYEIDVLSEACVKDGVSIAPLSIAGELTVWFKKDLEDAHIDFALVRTARLHVKIDIERLVGGRRTNVAFPGKDGASYVRCRIDCHALLESGDDRYEAEKEDYDEWPYPLSKTAQQVARAAISAVTIRAAARLAPAEIAAHLDVRLKSCGGLVAR